MSRYGNKLIDTVLENVAQITTHRVLQPQLDVSNGHGTLGPVLAPVIERAAGAQQWVPSSLHCAANLRKPTRKVHGRSPNAVGMQSGVQGAPGR